MRLDDSLLIVIDGDEAFSVTPLYVLLNLLLGGNDEGEHHSSR